MSFVLRRPSGETAPVHAIHLNGDASPGGHRYSFCPELLTATQLDVYCGQAILPIGAGERFVLVDDAHEFAAVMIESFDLRDHALVRCRPHPGRLA